MLKEGFLQQWCSGWAPCTFESGWWQRTFLCLVQFFTCMLFFLQIQKLAWEHNHHTHLLQHWWEWNHDPHKHESGAEMSEGAAMQSNVHFDRSKQTEMVWHFKQWMTQNQHLWQVNTDLPVTNFLNFWKLTLWCILEDRHAQNNNHQTDLRSAIASTIVGGFMISCSRSKAKQKRCSRPQKHQNWTWARCQPSSGMIKRAWGTVQALVSPVKQNQNDDPLSLTQISFYQASFGKAIWWAGHC